MGTGHAGERVAGTQRIAARPPDATLCSAGLCSGAARSGCQHGSGDAHRLSCIGHGLVACPDRDIGAGGPIGMAYVLAKMGVVALEIRPGHAAGSGHGLQIRAGGQSHSGDLALIRGIQRLEAQIVQIFHDGRDSQESRHVLTGLFLQSRLFVQLVVLADHAEEGAFPGSLAGTSHLALAGIVGGYGRGPVIEVLVQALQISGGRMGCLVDVHALILPAVLLQAELHACIGHELPGTSCTGMGAGFGIVTAFHQGQIGKLLGHVVGSKHALGIGQVPFGSLGDHCHGLAAVAQEDILVLPVGHGGFRRVTEGRGQRGGKQCEGQWYAVHVGLLFHGFGFTRNAAPTGGRPGPSRSRRARRPSTVRARRRGRSLRR